MNNLQIFNNAEFGSIRTVEQNGQIWFCGVDVANALEYKNSRDAISRHCKNEGVVKHDTPTSSGIQSIVFINEPNLYRLITHSKLPSAEKFERWVFEEVLPSIRKTGHYGNTPLKDVVNLIRITRDNMERQGATPTQIAETINGICEQYGINLPNFVIHPEQVTMKNVFDMVDYVFSQPRGRGHKAPTYDDYIAHKTNVKMIGGD